MVEFDKDVELRSGMPDMNDLNQTRSNTLLIFDDLMYECTSTTLISKLYSVIARKRNISVIILVQNIYNSGLRNIRLNCTGMVLFKFHAGMDVNKRVIRDLGLADLITKTQINSIYEDRHSYIYLDIHPNRQFDFGTIKANIFDKFITVYHNRMRYIAIPESDFIKYFKVIENKVKSA